MYAMDTKEYLQYIVRMESSQYLQKIGEMEEKLKNFEEQGKKTGKTGADAFSKITDKVKGMLNPATLVAGAVAYLGYRTVQAAKDFGKFQESMSKVNTLMQVGRKELEDYGNEFMNLSKGTGLSADSIAQGAYEALSAGISKDNLVKYMDTITKTSIAGFTDINTSIKAVSSVLNAYNMEQKEAAQVADVLLSIQKNGQTTIAELGNTLSNVIPVAAAFRVSFQDVAGAIATLTAAGVPTAQATTQIRSTIAELGKEGTSASKIFNQMTGKTFPEFIASGGNLEGALLNMEAYAKVTNRSMIDLFSSIEAGQGALGLTGKNFDKFSKNIGDAKDSAGELEEAFKIATDNMMTEWRKFVEGSKNNWMNFIKEIEPGITWLLKQLNKLNENPIKNSDKYVGERLGNGFKTSDIVTPQKEQAKLEKERVEQQRKNYQELISQEEHLTLVVDAEARKRKATLEAEADAAAKKLKSEEDKIDAEKDRVAAVKRLDDRTFSDRTELDIKMLKLERDKLNEVQKLYAAGELTEKEYSARIRKIKEESTEERRKEEIQMLKNFSDTYKKLGNIAKAIALDKQILEIEVQLSGTEKLKDIDPGEVKLNSFQEGQLQAQKEFQTQMLANEWDYIAELENLRVTQGFSDEEFSEKKNNFKFQQATLEEMFNIQQLENLRDFYLNENGMREQALEVQERIVEKRNSLNTVEKKMKETQIRWETWAEKSKVDIQQSSADAVLSIYDEFAAGNLKSLEDFKEFAKQQVGALLAQKGSEHAALAISETGKAAVFATSGLYSKAGEALASAAKQATIAATFGVGASMLSQSSSSSSEQDNSKNEFDKGIEERAEAGKDSEGTVFIDISDSAMAKVMVKQIEKELGDGYNVTLTGKKK